MRCAAERRGGGGGGTRKWGPLAKEEREGRGDGRGARRSPPLCLLSHLYLFIFAGLLFFRVPVHTHAGGGAEALISSGPELETPVVPCVVSRARGAVDWKRGRRRQTLDNSGQASLPRHVNRLVASLAGTQATNAPTWTATTTPCYAGIPGPSR